MLRLSGTAVAFLPLRSTAAMMATTSSLSFGCVLKGLIKGRIVLLIFSDEIVERKQREPALRISRSGGQRRIKAGKRKHHVAALIAFARYGLLS